MPRRSGLLLVALIAWCLTLAQSGRAQQEGAPAPAAHPPVAFDTADNCMACHNGMRTPAGEDVSIGTAWRASMMANSARDPYWQAAVRRETIDHPTKQAVIEDECSICHMPMAHSMARAAGGQGEVFNLLPNNAVPASPERVLAADGVSCTLCHQVSPDGLGSRESFVGGFVLASPDSGERRMFGPYEVDRGRTTLMRSATGVRPAQGEHLRQSEMCATCHTLITEAYDERGQAAGSLPEQVPYLEWRHSAFREERSCQACHMPEAQATPISSVLGEARERLSRHTFLGGNFFMLRMLSAHADELGVTALPEELEAAAAGTLRQLGENTASVAVTNAELRDGILEADVDVRNRTGHKLPTGYPSRRVWLHVSVLDAQGATIFDSGRVLPNGAIDGNDNDADPSRMEPHYTRITAADQVQIYEAIMGDPQRRVTTGLLRATMFLKDNRLLPRGFDKRTAEPEIAVAGTALDDADFTGEGDRVRYEIRVGAAPGPYTVQAELLFQTIGFRWADNLRSYDAVEPQRFVRYFDGMAAESSAVLARTSVAVGSR